jgi:mono/diheme cytochrome c family protein
MVKIPRFGSTIFVLTATLLLAGQPPAWAALQPGERFLNDYCVTCHNARARTGGLDLSSFSISETAASRETGEKVIKKLRAGTMPPAGSKRPPQADYAATATWLENELDRLAAQQPHTALPFVHRMNRTEYANAIRDLLSLEIDAAAFLPPDDAAFGFDNVSDTLGVSPALQERYLTSALKIAALALGSKDQAKTSQTWRIPQDRSQNQHIEGLPLGTVGGTSAKYNFPLDGEYELRATIFRTNLNIPRGLQIKHEVEFAIDGKRVHLASIGGPDDLAAMFEKPTETGDAVDARLRVRVPVTAGPHTLTVAFVDNSLAAEPVRLEPFLRSSVDNFDWAGHPHFQTLTVAGPLSLAATASLDTPSRRKIFLCRPTRVELETACAQRIVSTLVRRAFRQPADPADIARAMRFYESGRNGASFDAGIQAALERILASPKFLYRAEHTADAPPGATSSKLVPLTGLELASRLSFFLWSSIPDDRLIELGARGTLPKPAVLEAEVQRMLADPKAAALVDNFAGQWLQLRNLKTFQPNTDRFPNFDDNLRQSLRRETELLFQSIITGNRSVLELLTADYTFVNERLARHYGISGVYGSRFRRVPVESANRRGLLGHGSILALTSHAERTSPVVRGKWILENLLGQAVPSPPANVPPLKERADGEKPKTMREQMAEHRANPVCAACHKTMDPIGFALENYDAVGAWRSHDSGLPIDASGELADGTKVDGVVELRAALMRYPAMFASTVASKMMVYALGRGLDYRDQPEVRSIVRKAEPTHYRFGDLLMGIVRSQAFQMKPAQAAVAQN